MHLDLSGATVDAAWSALGFVLGLVVCCPLKAYLQQRRRTRR